MKKSQWFFVRVVLIAGLIQLVSSCSTVPKQTTADTTQRFHGDTPVNAVLRFSSWDYTFLVQPQYTEKGFLQPVGRENIEHALDQLHVRRGTAVVVIGWTYKDALLNRLVADWKSILGGCGFQRVVILRPQPSNKLEGSVIIDDSILRTSAAQTISRGS